jgi:hypothetical protein
MPQMVRKALKTLAILVMAAGPGASPAAATGDLVCSIDDQNLDFALFASVGREHGTIVNVVEGSLTLKVAPFARLGRDLKVEQEHVIQQWFLERELRIGISLDTAAGSLLLALIGEREPDKPEQVEDTYSGRYVLTAWFPDGSTHTAAGRIKGCSTG